MLLKELKNELCEQALDVKNIEDLWHDNQDLAKQYVSTTTYLVRPVPDSKPIMYEVFSVNGSTRKLFGKMNEPHLKRTLVPIRPNQTPDVEGFITYLDSTRVQAIQYAGDSVDVDVDGTKLQLDAGEYLVREVSGGRFIYSIEGAGDFESKLKIAD